MGQQVVVYFKKVTRECFEYSTQEETINVWGKECEATLISVFAASIGTF